MLLLQLCTRMCKHYTFLLLLSKKEHSWESWRKRRTIFHRIKQRARIIKQQKWFPRWHWNLRKYCFNVVIKKPRHYQGVNRNWIEIQETVSNQTEWAFIGRITRRKTACIVLPNIQHEHQGVEIAHLGTATIAKNIS